MEYLFIFSPGLSFNGEFKKNILHNNDNIYIGGSDRLLSASIIINKYNNIVLVGGDTCKINCMESFLTKNNPNCNVIQLISNPNTEGNILAIKKYLKINNITKGIYFLSNIYHFTRILTYYFYNNNSPDINLLFAEEILQDNNMVSDVNYSKELIYRYKSEYKGLKQYLINNSRIKYY